MAMTHDEMVDAAARYMRGEGGQEADDAVRLLCAAAHVYHCRSTRRGPVDDFETLRGALVLAALKVAAAVAPMARPLKSRPRRSMRSA